LFGLPGSEKLIEKGGDILKKIDPTRISKADTGQVEESKKRLDEALAQGQGIIERRMGETKAPTVEKVAGPQAGRIDTQFLKLSGDKCLLVLKHCKVQAVLRLWHKHRHKRQRAY